MHLQKVEVKSPRKWTGFSILRSRDQVPSNLLVPAVMSVSVTAPLQCCSFTESLVQFSHWDAGQRSFSLHGWSGDLANPVSL